MVPNLVTVSVFVSYVAWGYTLTTTNAFIIITIFMLMQEPLRMFPILVQEATDVKVSLDRIEKFLRSTEISNDYIRRTLPAFTNNNAIEIKGNFYWKKGKFDEEDDDDDDKKKKKKRRRKKRKKKIF